MKARVSYKEAGIVIQFPWLISFDQTVWTSFRDEELIGSGCSQRSRIALSHHCRRAGVGFA